MPDNEHLRVTANYILMNSGRQFWPVHPRVEDIELNDIAHSLAMQCRWNGHIKDINNHYSVAQHSVLVSHRVQSDESRLWGLLHDATEAYLCDVPRPLKPYLPEYGVIEERLAKAVRLKFGIILTDKIRKEVDKADMDLLFMERDELLCGLKVGEAPEFAFDCEELRPKETIYSVDDGFFCWSAGMAKRTFLRRFKKLALDSLI